MSVLTSLPTQPIVPDSPHREEAAHFVRWVLEALGFEVREDERRGYIELPLEDRPAFGGRERVRLPLATPAPDAGEEESFEWNGRFGAWLLQRLRRAGPALHARPRSQPMGVSEIANQLYAAYSVDGGQVHLSGCQLTDHPFVRLSFASTDAAAGDAAVRHVFVAPDGSSVSDELAPQLGLDDLEPIRPLATEGGPTHVPLRSGQNRDPARPPRLDDGALRSLIAAGRRISAKQSTSRDPTATTIEPLAATVVWVRHAEGRLQFTIGGASESLSFSSWAKLLKPPPFVARGSGAASYRVGATDDGRIDAADAIETCRQSGRRVLSQELVTCSVTGQRMLPEFTETCPVSGRPALRREFAACSLCGQRVSQAVLSDGVCAACRSLSKVRKDDPRLLWIIGEHPGLDRWRRWRLAESATTYIAEATGLTKRLLVVVDKETLAIRRLATAGRLAPAWTDVPEVGREEVLK